MQFAVFTGDCLLHWLDFRKIPPLLLKEKINNLFVIAGEFVHPVEQCA